MTEEEISAADDDEAREIGLRIAKLREDRKLTNARLAELMGVSVDAIKKTVAGGATKRYAQLRRLARVLKVTPNEILGVNDTRDIDELAATISCSYVSLGLPPEEADELAQLVLEVSEEPLSASSKRDRLAGRRALTESRTRKFFAAKPPREPVS